MIHAPLPPPTHTFSHTFLPTHFPSPQAVAAAGDYERGRSMIHDAFKRGTWEAPTVESYNALLAGMVQSLKSGGRGGHRGSGADPRVPNQDAVGGQASGQGTVPCSDLPALYLPHHIYSPSPPLLRRHGGSCRDAHGIDVWQDARGDASLLAAPLSSDACTPVRGGGGLHTSLLAAPLGSDACAHVRGDGWRGRGEGGGNGR